MNKESKILVAGYRGLVGSAITRQLEKSGYLNILKIDKDEVNLTNQADVNEYFANERPEYIFLAAAKVGGIIANSTYPADFIRDNLLIQTLTIDAAYRGGVKRLLFLGSSCIYPKFSLQPMKEEYLLTGLLEPTNEPYAIAKIAGIKMCQSYRRQYGFNSVCLMPTNLYGPGDNFDLENSHVMPALIRKFHEAKVSGSKSVEIWGSGAPKREFLYVEDLASAAVFVMEQSDEALDSVAPDRIFNVGVGKDATIGELAKMVREVIYKDAELHFDTTKPDGTPQKLLDVTRMSNLGWSPSIDLRIGLIQTYNWYLKHKAASIQKEDL